jgi:hypothetical protein
LHHGPAEIVLTGEHASKLEIIQSIDDALGILARLGDGFLVLGLEPQV